MVSTSIVEGPADDLDFVAGEQETQFMRPAVIALSLVLLCAAVPAGADPVADFYKGKQMRFVIRSNVGGTYDLYGRLLSRHLSPHIPGNHTILPINIGSGSGIEAANSLAETSTREAIVR